MPEKTVSEMTEAEYQAARKIRAKAPKKEDRPVMLMTPEEYTKARRRLAGNPRD